MSIFHQVRAAALVLLAGLAAFGAEEGNRPFPPFKIAGNLYYVGADDIASYLIATPQGHVLINTGYESTPAIIAANIEKLGFKLTDVKILLNSQAHFDHVAGQAAMKEMTGAEVWVSEADAPLIESGGRNDFVFGDRYTFPPVRVSRRFKDGEKITIGGSTIVAHITPGHTKGCTTFTMQVMDAGKSYDVVFVGGTAINPGTKLVDNPKYPAIQSDYARTWRILRALKCDLFLGAHGQYFDLKQKYARLEKGGQPNPFIDPNGYSEYLDRSEKSYNEYLAKERSSR